jgi:hypothetical protein
MKFAPSLLHPISHPSQYHTFKTLTQRWVGKIGITLQSELKIRHIFLKLGRIKFHIQPDSDPGWCFKFHAKNCGIYVGHTFCPIELKIGMLPILVIQNQKNKIKNRIKSQKLDFYWRLSPAVSSIEEFSSSAALSFSFCLCFVFVLHFLFVSSYSTSNIGSPSNESLHVNTCSTWFSIMKLHLSRHHILPSKLHLLLRRTDLTLHSPHALLIITRPPVATCSVSRTLVRVG